MTIQNMQYLYPDAPPMPPTIYPDFYYLSLAVITLHQQMAYMASQSRLVNHDRRCTAKGIMAIYMHPKS